MSGGGWDISRTAGLRDCGHSRGGRPEETIGDAQGIRTILASEGTPLVFTMKSM